MPLYHFSEDPHIEVFEPRPVVVPSERPAGMEWLNGPLVWAIDEWHSPMFLFPRECPRILLWAVPTTTEQDRERWFAGRSDIRMIAHIEWAWLERLCATPIYRYAFADESFEPLHDPRHDKSMHDIGYYVARTSVRPTGVSVIRDLPGALREAAVELRVMPSLRPIRGVWDTTIHFSGSRLRNAVGWDAQEDLVVVSGTTETGRATAASHPQGGHGLGRSNPKPKMG